MRELKGECKSASVTCCEVTQSGSCVAEPPPRGPTDATRPWGGGEGAHGAPRSAAASCCPPKAALKREDCTVLPDAASKK